jgi:hypothetical protein
MSEDKSQVEETNEEQRQEDDEPDVEAHRMKARRLPSPEDAPLDPGDARAKRLSGL